MNARNLTAGILTVPFFCRKRAVFLRGIRMLSGHTRFRAQQPYPAGAAARYEPRTSGKGVISRCSESKSGLFQPRGRNSAFAFTDPGSAAALPRLAPPGPCEQEDHRKGSSAAAGEAATATRSRLISRPGHRLQKPLFTDMRIAVFHETRNYTRSIITLTGNDDPLLCIWMLSRAVLGETFSC